MFGRIPDTRQSDVDGGIPTRMGDGSLAWMSRSEVRADLEAGTQDGANRAKVPALGDSELDHLLDIFASKVSFTAVDLGQEVILSCDGSGNADLPRLAELYSYQSHLGADIVELSGWTTPSRRSRTPSTTRPT